MRMISVTRKNHFTKQLILLLRKCRASRLNINFRISEWLLLTSVNLMSLICIVARKSNSDSFYVTIVEVLIMAGLGFFQIYYIKKVLDNRRMI